MLEREEIESLFNNWVKDRPLTCRVIGDGYGVVITRNDQGDVKSKTFLNVPSNEKGVQADFETPEEFIEVLNNNLGYFGLEAGDAGERGSQATVRRVGGRPAIEMRPQREGLQGHPYPEG